MEVPLKISFRGVEKTQDIVDLIHEKAAKLEQVNNELISCRVAVERRHQHQRAGNPFRVRIDMRVPPGNELVAERKSTEGDLHEPLSKVIRDTFEAARRQLKELRERQRGEVKSHPEQEIRALVAMLFREEGYGFLRALDGHEIYFHRNSVLHGDFDRLEIGTGVTFAEHQGEEGPQASSVEIVDKPGSTTS